MSKIDVSPFEGKLIFEESPITFEALKQALATPLPVQPVYAAVDVGSHNVRMDLYGIDARDKLIKIKLPIPTAFDCSLAQDLSEDNLVIKIESRRKANVAMEMFSIILSEYKIQAENTCVALTEAARAVKDTQRGKLAITNWVKKLGVDKNNCIILTGEEESLLVGLACKRARPKNWPRKNNTAPIIYVAIGGGSIELGVIMPDGTIVHNVALSLGVLRLRSEGGTELKSIIKYFRQRLEHDYQIRARPGLMMAGGYFRTLFKAEKDGLPYTAEDKKELVAIIDLAERREPQFYDRLGQRARTRANDMKLVAAVLREVADYFETETLHVPKITMRDEMAHIMHDLRIGAAMRPPAGLERLFSHVTPSLDLRA